MGILNRLLGRRRPTSSEIARERLQLVLVQDRIKISPATMDNMKDELITVISRYVEIEPDDVKVTLTYSRHQSRLVADIPVVGVVGRSSIKTVIASTGTRRSG